MKTILFYGDSNTWGFDPSTCGRYPLEERWTTICQQMLGTDFYGIPAGMNGRTTVFDDPFKGCRNGLEGLDYELQSHKPLDLVVLMLGINDLKFTDAAGSAAGMRTVVEHILTVNDRFAQSFPVFPDRARILLVSPVLITGYVNDNTACDESRESEKLASLYQEIARENGLDFLDAAKVTGPSRIDGVHLSPEGHARIGRAIASKILELWH